MRMIVEWKFEDDHVTMEDGPVGQNPFVPGTSSFENKLVNQQMVADQKRRFHRLGRNLESLHDESGAEQREQNGDQQRFEKLHEAAGRPLANGGSSHNGSHLYNFRRVN